MASTEGAVTDEPRRHRSWLAGFLREFASWASRPAQLDGGREEMENKLVSHCDLELLKTAMLRHEETFRQQVHELHRLYRVQQQLMGALSSELSCRRQIRRRRRQTRRALDLQLHLPADVVAPPSSADDGLELTLAIGSGGRCRKRRRDETESTGTAIPLGSESENSGGSLTTASSSTDTGGSPPYKRAMPVKQPPRSPWLVRCVSLEMA